MIVRYTNILYIYIYLILFQPIILIHKIRLDFHRSEYTLHPISSHSRPLSLRDIRMIIVRISLRDKERYRLPVSRRVWTLGMDENRGCGWIVGRMDDEPEGRGREGKKGDWLKRRTPPSFTIDIPVWTLLRLSVNTYAARRCSSNNGSSKWGWVKRGGEGLVTGKPPTTTRGGLRLDEKSFRSNQSHLYYRSTSLGSRSENFFPARERDRFNLATVFLPLSLFLLLWNSPWRFSDFQQCRFEFLDRRLDGELILFLDRSAHELSVSGHLTTLSSLPRPLPLVDRYILDSFQAREEGELQRGELRARQPRLDNQHIDQRNKGGQRRNCVRRETGKLERVSISLPRRASIVGRKSGVEEKRVTKESRESLSEEKQDDVVRE